MKDDFAKKLLALVLPIASQQFMSALVSALDSLMLGALSQDALSASYLLTGVSQAYLCILKNSGRAVKSSVIGCTSVVLNIILNAILIFGLLGAGVIVMPGVTIGDNVVVGAGSIVTKDIPSDVIAVGQSRKNFHSPIIWTALPAEIYSGIYTS